MHGKSILILGGGVGGIVAANALRQLLPHEHSITVVEKSRIHSFAPSFLWLAVGDRDKDEISTVLDTLLENGVDLVIDEVVRIDVAGRKVQISNGTIGYDYLIVALGADYAMDSVKGLAESGISLYTREGASEIRDELRKITRGDIAIVVSALPYKCPAAPHESAMLIASNLAKRGLKKSVHVNLYTPEPQPMPVAGKQLGVSVTQLLVMKGIGYHPQHKLIEVDGANKTLHFEDATTFPYDLLIAIPPHTAPMVAVRSGLTNEMGWIPVDRNTLQTTHADVYAIGDITAVELPGRWNPDVKMMLPKAGVFAHAQAEVVAQRIAEEINGIVPGSMFHGVGYCMLEAGDGVAGFAQGDFYATPTPQLTMRNVGRKWHIGKVLFEKWWLAPIGFKKNILYSMMSIGSRFLKIPK